MRERAGCSAQLRHRGRPRDQAPGGERVQRGRVAGGAHERGEEDRRGLIGVPADVGRDDTGVDHDERRVVGVDDVGQLVVAQAGPVGVQLGAGRVQPGGLDGAQVGVGRADVFAQVDGSAHDRLSFGGVVVPGGPPRTTVSQVTLTYGIDPVS